MFWEVTGPILGGKGACLGPILGGRGACLGPILGGKGPVMDPFWAVKGRPGPMPGGQSAHSKLRGPTSIQKLEVRAYDEPIPSSSALVSAHGARV